MYHSALLMFTQWIRAALSLSQRPNYSQPSALKIAYSCFPPPLLFSLRSSVIAVGPLSSYCPPEPPFEVRPGV